MMLNYFVDHPTIESCAAELSVLSAVTEEQILSFWSRNDEKVDLEKMTYRWDCSVAEKMVWRLRHCHGSICCFYNQLSPVDQSYLLGRLQLHSTKLHSLILFFAWLGNGLGSFEVGALRPEDEQFTPDEFVQLWRKDQINFYRRLKGIDQEELIGRYNIEFLRHD